MESVSTDAKLRLVQKIREENQENRRKMRSREQLLNYPVSYIDNDREEGISGFKAEEHPFWGLRIRIGLALLLFLGFIVLDYTNIQIGTVSAESVLSLMEEKAELNPAGLLKEVSVWFDTDK